MVKSPLQLSRTEQAIPHILLDRQQGIKLANNSKSHLPITATD